MMTFYCRALGIPDSLCPVEVEDGEEEYAADNFVHENVRMTEVGQATFIEVAPSAEGPWELWVCKCVGLFGGGGFMLMTGRTTYAQAEQDLKQYGGTSPNENVRKWQAS